MHWWQFALGGLWALLLWFRLRRARRGADTRLLAGSQRDLGGRGGF